MNRTGGLYYQLFFSLTDSHQFHKRQTVAPKWRSTVFCFGTIYTKSKNQKVDGILSNFLGTRKMDGIPSNFLSNFSVRQPQNKKTIVVQFFAPIFQIHSSRH